LAEVCLGFNYTTSPIPVKIEKQKNPTGMLPHTQQIKQNKTKQSKKEQANTS
jgi:hypothetical protein